MLIVPCLSSFGPMRTSFLQYLWNGHAADLNKLWLKLYKVLEVVTLPACCLTLATKLSLVAMLSYSFTFQAPSKILDGLPCWKRALTSLNLKEAFKQVDLLSRFVGNACAVYVEHFPGSCFCIPRHPFGTILICTCGVWFGVTVRYPLL